MKHNIGVIISIWAPIVLVKHTKKPFLDSFYFLYFSKSLLYVWHVGLFHGHSDLVCDIFHCSWRDSWSLQPLGWSRCSWIISIFIVYTSWEISTVCYSFSKNSSLVWPANKLNLEVALSYLMNVFSQIRTLGMLRSRFESVPSAFSDRLVPCPSGVVKKKQVLTLMPIYIVFYADQFLS